MSKPLDERVKKILKELDLDPKECLWQTHGTWVMYHRYIEIAGVKHNINYELAEVEMNSLQGCVCIKCHAWLEIDAKEIPVLAKSVTTYGEASPANNKNAYPYAMAEKRAVDRAILKLLGLHGFIYSEDEMPPEKVIKKGKGVHSPVQELSNELSKDELDLGKARAKDIQVLIDEGFNWKALDVYLESDMEVRTAIWDELQGEKSKDKGGNGQFLTYTGILKKYHVAEENGERPTTGDL